MPIPLAALAPLAVHLLPAAAGMIGQALAGPRGEAIGEQIGEAVQALTGTDDPAAARQAIADNPAVATELRVRLETILAEAALAIAREENEARRIAAADTADARRNAIETLRVGGSTRMRDTVAIANIGLFAASAIGAVLAIMHNGDPLVVAAASTVLGVTAGSYKDTVSYFLGSSQGSAAKDARLAAIERRAPAP